MLIRFEWDPVKAAINLRKHGIGFDIAVLAFADPFALTGQDRIEDGEQRWQTLGTVAGELLLVVAHTSRDDDEENQLIEVIGVSFRPERPTGRRGDVMSKKLV